MKLKAHTWKCTSCKVQYVEDSSQLIESGITQWTVQNLREFIDEHDKKTGHKGFNLK